MISTDEVTSEGKKLLLQMFEDDSENVGVYRLIKESLDKEDGPQEDE